MNGLEFPFLSIITPVHNGARFLADCIESVAAQSYPRFEHVIVDNASTDETSDVAARYARDDSRIRIVCYGNKLPIIANWNRALANASDHASYVWVLPADDMMMGEAVLQMMAIARKTPSVGVISSLRLRGNQVQNGGLPLDQNVFSGRDIVRQFLRGEVFAFSPTGSIFRRDLIEPGQAFYPENYVHADTAAFFNILHRVDFGFAHDILMFSRVHDGTVTSRIVNRRGTDMHDHVMMLADYGPYYFEMDELDELKASFARRYYRFLVRNAVLMRERAFFDYHLDVLRTAGFAPGAGVLARAAIGELGRLMIRPGRAFDHVAARLRMISVRDQIWSDRTAS